MNIEGKKNKNKKILSLYYEASMNHYASFYKKFHHEAKGLQHRVKHGNHLSSHDSK